MKKIKVVVVKNEYGDAPNVYYRWDNVQIYLESILEEIKVNIEEGYPISIEIIEMTENKFNKIPELD